MGLHTDAYLVPKSLGTRVDEIVNHPDFCKTQTLIESWDHFHLLHDWCESAGELKMDGSVVLLIDDKYTAETLIDQMDTWIETENEMAPKNRDGSDDEGSTSDKSSKCVDHCSQCRPHFICGDFGYVWIHTVESFIRTLARIDFTKNSVVLFSS